MKDNFYNDKVVVITGGSSGIGLAVAKEFAKLNAKLVLIARDEQKLLHAKSLLKPVTHNNVIVLVADVSIEADIEAAINMAGSTLGRIDVLINSAGITRCGRYADQPADHFEACMHINYMGSLYASRAAWPWLKKVNGQLSFVSSVVGYMGLIGYSSYAPPKFAVTGLAECLWMEGKQEGIKVSIIYPPDTDTPLLQYEKKHALPESKALSKNIETKSAEEVARIYVKSLKQNKFEIFCDHKSPLLRWFKNTFPALYRYLLYRTIKNL